MKKAAQIILIITGIVDILASFNVLLVLTLSTGPLVLLFLFIPLMFLLAGIFALVAARKGTKGGFIVSLVFGALIFDWLTVLASILGFSGAATERKVEYIETIDDQGVVQTKAIVTNDPSQERPLSGAGKGLKIGAKVFLGLSTIRGLLSILSCILFVILGLGGIVFANVSTIMELSPVINTATDFQSVIDYFLESELFSAYLVTFAAGLIVIITGLLFFIPSILSFIFSFAGFTSRKNKKGVYIANIVVSILSLSGLEFLGGLLGTIGVSLKKKENALVKK